MIRFFFLIVIMLLPVWAATAQPVLPMADFARLPILHDGRIKPLDSVARLTYQTIAGEDADNTTTAVSWLAKQIFTPEKAVKEASFYIGDSVVIKTLGLETSRSKTYSAYVLADHFARIAPLLEQLHEADPSQLDKEQRALLDLYEAFALYSQLTGSLSLFVHFDEASPSLWERISTAGKDMRLNKRLETLYASGSQNTFFRVIPDKQHIYITPWQAARIPDSQRGYRDNLNVWSDLTKAYRTQDQKLWQTTLHHLHEINAPFMREKKISANRLQLEIQYHQLKPYRLALIFYALACVFGILAGRNFYPRITGLIATFSGITGFLWHGFAQGARIIILQRPPVGTLYESLLFVGFIVMLCSVAFLAVRRKPQPVWISSFIAALLLIIAPSLNTQGDPLEVLIAVLNTNLWLTTHVLVITTGYGLSLLAVCCAHIGLVTMRHDRHRNWLLASHITTLAALFFTATGTVLGGIWADQSWGRFWGWDPKENGALLLTLWQIWVIHGRLSRHLNDSVYLAMIAMMSVIVAVSWFGVNLLGIGLHSYGFIDGMLWSLVAFCTVQTLIVFFLYMRAAPSGKRYGA